MKHFDKKAQKFVSNMIFDTMPVISVQSGLCRYNFRCQHNAVNDAFINNQDKIAMCFYFDGGRPIIHFININSDGSYTDNTLGQWSRTFQYYLIRIIEKDDFFKVNTIFFFFFAELQKKMPFFTRTFSTIEF